MVALNLVLNLVFIWPLGTAGLALATAIGATLQLVILSLILIRRYNLSLKQGLLATTLKTIFATIAMTLTTTLIPQFNPLAQLATMVITAIATFAIVSLLLKNTEALTLFRKK